MADKLEYGMQQILVVSGRVFYCMMPWTSDCVKDMVENGFEIYIHTVRGASDSEVSIIFGSLRVCNIWVIIIVCVSLFVICR